MWAAEKRRLCYGVREASFEAKTSNDGPAFVGSRRDFSGVGGKHIGSGCADGGYAVARNGTAFNGNTRRRRNFRHQLVDILYLRQGSRQANPRPKSGGRLPMRRRRLPSGRVRWLPGGRLRLPGRGLRLPGRRLRLRSGRLWLRSGRLWLGVCRCRLCGLRRLQLHLLPLLGSLSALLDSSLE